MIVEEEQVPKIKNILITTLLGLVFSVALSHIFYHRDLSFGNPFVYHSIVMGMTGAFVFSALKFSNLTDSLFALLGTFLLNWLIFEKTLNFAYILRDIIFWASLWLSIYYYQHWWFDRLRRLRFVRPLALAAIYGMVNCIMGDCWYLYTSYFINNPTPVLIHYS